MYLRYFKEKMNRFTSFTYFNVLITNTKRTSKYKSFCFVHLKFVFFV